MFTVPISLKAQNIDTRSFRQSSSHGANVGGSRFGVVYVEETIGDLEEACEVTNLGNKLQNILEPTSRVTFTGSISIASCRTSSTRQTLGIRPKKKTPVQIQFKPKSQIPSSCTPSRPTPSAPVQALSLCPSTWPPLHGAISTTPPNIANLSPTQSSPSQVSLLKLSNKVDGPQILVNPFYMKTHPLTEFGILPSDK